MSTHRCHWPDCTKAVPPAMWGCRTHWFMLPRFLRDLVWKVYVPGQEVTKRPSKQYLAVAAIVRDWCVAAYAPLIRVPGSTKLRPVTDAERRQLTLRVKHLLTEEGVI